MFLIFLERVKVTFVCLKHCSKTRQTTAATLVIVSEHNRPRSESSNVVAGLPVPMSCDCVDDSACDSSSHFDFE